MLRQASATLLVLLCSFGCGKKLDQDDCDHLLGRALGLHAYPGAEPLQKEMGVYGGVPLDIPMLKKTARGAAKQAIEGFDKACVGTDDGGAVACGRRAKNAAEFAACGGIVAKADEAGKIGRAAVTRKFSVDECAKFAERGVQVKAVTADDVPQLIKQCEDWLEIGFYECRVGARDAAAWNACDHP